MFHFFIILINENYIKRYKLYETIIFSNEIKTSVDVLIIFDTLYICILQMKSEYIVIKNIIN